LLSPRAGASRVVGAVFTVLIDFFAEAHDAPPLRDSSIREVIQSSISLSSQPTALEPSLIGEGKSPD